MVALSVGLLASPQSVVNSVTGSVLSLVKKEKFCGFSFWASSHTPYPTVPVLQSSYLLQNILLAAFPSSTTEQIQV